MRELTEAAARWRAMRAYSGMLQSELGELLELSTVSVKRREGASSGPSQQPTVDELLAVAGHCGVPAWFALHGWSGLDESLVRRMELAVADALGRVRLVIEP